MSKATTVPDATGARGAAVLDVIAARRSVKRFRAEPVPRATLERLLDCAVCAPNHRLTQPWRFYVLGPRARRAYGDALGARKARRVEDPGAAAQVRAKVAAEHEALPAVIAFAVRLDENPEIREEDIAATWMAVQNVTLAAAALGLGTHIKTGAVMQDPAARTAVGVADDERIIALVNIGVPEELPAPKARLDAAQLTAWRD
jgi:nitroreductase